MIISIIFFIAIVIIELFILIKKTDTKQTIIFKKTKSLILIFVLLDILISSILLIYNIHKNNSYNTLILYLLFFPIELINLKSSISLNDENISCVKYVIFHKIISKQQIHLFNKADIKVIMLTNNKPSYNIKTYDNKKIKKNIFSENIIINNTETNDIKKYLDNYEEDISLNTIENARGKYDNYLRSIKKYIISYLTIIFSYNLFTILGYPLVYNINLLLLIKIINILVNKYIYEYLPNDTDLMVRTVRKKGKLFYKQELIFLIMQSCFLFFGLTISYSYIISYGYDLPLATSVLYITYLYMNLFVTITIYSEKIFLINLIRSIKNIRMIIYILLTIAITIALIYFKLFDIINIGFKNYFGCIIFAVFFTIIYEITKLARYTSLRKK